MSRQRWAFLAFSSGDPPYLILGPKAHPLRFDQAIVLGQGPLKSAKRDNVKYPVRKAVGSRCLHR